MWPFPRSADHCGDAAEPDRLRLPASLAGACALVWRSARVLAAGYVLTSLVAGLLPVVSVALLARIADGVARSSGLHSLVPLAAASGVVGLLIAVVPAVGQYLVSELQRVTGRAAQDALYAATERIGGLAPFEDPAFRDRLQLAQLGGRSGPAQIFAGSVGLAQGAITVVGLAAVLASVNPVIAVVAVLAAVPALVVELRISRGRADVMLRVTPIERREFFYAELLTSLDAAKEVRLLGLASLFRRRMMAELTAADQRRRGIDRRELRAQVWVAALTAAVTGGGLLWTVLASRHDGVSVGGVVAYLAGMGGLQAAMTAQVSRAAAIHQANAMFAHFRAITARGPDPIAAPSVSPAPLPALRSRIAFRQVWFRYGPTSAWVLRGVDLDLEFGSATALVGRNGAGKSTLIKLLCRFYDPERGQILWDGVDIRTVPVTELRDRIGAVFQDFMTYDLTVAENIGLGDVAAAADRERLTAAAGRAGIDGVLAALPRSYDTLLSRGFVDADADDPAAGVLLSGGQWQRLALARAFMRDQRDLLILDEPSSGLDAQAEYEVHARLRAHRRGSTSLLISHRLGSIRSADRIVVLSGGRVIEQGSHAELMRADGEYAQLFRLQAAGYSDAAELSAADAELVRG